MNNLFIKSPLLFRILAILLASWFTVLQVQSIVNSFTRPTDENIFRDSARGVEVISVSKDGASEKAGMKVGDIIVSINGKKFSNSREANNILLQSRPDDVLVYTVLRESILINLYVQIAKVGVDWAQLILLFIALSTTTIGLFVGWLRAELLGARIFSIGLILFSNLFVPSLGQSELPLTIIQLSWAFSFPLLLHMRIYSPKINLRHYELKKLVRNYYVVSSAFFLFLHFMLPNLRVKAGEVSIPTIILIGAPQVFFIIYSLWVWIDFDKKQEAENKKPFQLIQVAFGLFALSYVVGNFLLNIFTYGRYVFVLGAAVPIIYYYIIIRHRLFGITRLVRRSLRHLIATIGLVTLSIWALINLIAFLIKFNIGGFGVRFTSFSVQGYPAPIGSTAEIGGQRFLYLIFGMGIAFGYAWVMKHLKYTLDKQFHQEDYDYRSALSEFAQIFAEKRNINELADAISDETIKLMSLKGMAIYLVTRETYELIVSRGCCDTFTVQKSSDVYSRLSSYTGITLYDETHSIPEFTEASVQLIVPLMIKDRQVGVMILAEKLSEDSYKKDDLEFIDSVSKQAAVALENARLTKEESDRRRLKRELEFARKVQQELLPETLPTLENLEIAGTYIAAGEVGGDYYDVIKQSNGNVSVLVGDVSGKGISAAMNMSRVQGVVRAITFENNCNPKLLLEKINNAIFSHTSRGTFITMISAEFNPFEHRLKIARAGHLPLLHFNCKTKALTLIKPNGIGLGLGNKEIFDKTVEEISFTYSEGDYFLFISDGVTDAKNNLGEEFGIDGLEKVLKSLPDLSAKEILMRIENALIDFAGNAEQYDDVTMLAVKAKPLKSTSDRM
ncbi:MAG: SpoIIE family protein phosphatase [Chloroherpetonaceae bacterium]|nr:SpoIIE family protein phosphatase [Chloroherpetonaceae bacterium]